MRRTRGRAGRRADTRRAFVTLEPGQKIEFF
jgi:ribosomal protein L23